MTPTVHFGLSDPTLPQGPLHLAIGMFDGVHLGHQAVIESALHSAARANAEAGVLTFWPHPSALVRPEHRARMIMSPEIKYEVLGRLGVRTIIQQPFGPDFAKISAEEFLPTLKKALPGLKALYVGDNWRFGAGRKGDVALLIKLAAAQNLTVLSAPRIQFNGAAISSTRIRECLSSGRIAEANELLGYSYFSEGESVPGRRLGRTIGFPTLNLPWEPELQPAYGVYAVLVQASDSAAKIPAIANFGLRPTVEDTKTPLLEIHVLGDCPFACGSALRVEWLQFIRPERRFAGLEELKTQIAQDLEVAKRFFASDKN